MEISLSLKSTFDFFVIHRLEVRDNYLIFYTSLLSRSFFNRRLLLLFGALILILNLLYGSSSHTTMRFFFFLLIKKKIYSREFYTLGAAEHINRRNWSVKVRAFKDVNARNISRSGYI